MPKDRSRSKTKDCYQLFGLRLRKKETKSGA